MFTRRTASSRTDGIALAAAVPPIGAATDAADPTADPATDPATDTPAGGSVSSTGATEVDAQAASRKVSSAGATQGFEAFIRVCSRR